MRAKVSIEKGYTKVIDGVTKILKDKNLTNDELIQLLAYANASEYTETKSLNSRWGVEAQLQLFERQIKEHTGK